MDWESVEMALNYLDVENPFRDTQYKFYLLIEMSGNQEFDLMETKMIDLFEKLDGKFEDGVLAQDETQLEKLWKIREGISLGTAHHGLTFKYDVSLSSDHFYDLVSQVQERVGSDGIVLGHGHIGDGNLHLNCCLKGFDNYDLAREVHG